MKKTLQFLLWLIILLMIIILIKTATFRSLQIKTEPVVLNLFGDESVERLSKSITFPTVSFSESSPVDTAAFKGYIAFVNEAYPLINSRLTREMFNEFSLLYTWKGKNTSLKPVVLMAHMDEVPVGDTSLWENPPYSGKNDGKYIWGRGTLDDKTGMISILEAVEKLLNEEFEPERTIYLVFGHDEEIGGHRGAGIIANALKERGTDAEFVLDEGLAITEEMVPMIKKNVALIGTSEKGYLSVKMAVDLPGGPSSTPEKESAITVLNSAIYHLINKKLKTKISRPLDDFIGYVGPEMPFFTRVLFANKWIFKRLLLYFYQKSASGNALVRTTSAPTIIQAGIRDDIIPAKAEAIVNFRILPGETTSGVLEHISKVVKDVRVRISPVEDGRSEPTPVSSPDAAGFKNIFTVIRQLFPGTVVAPTMILAPSDSRYFSEITKNIYRFAPIIINSEDMARIHGINERIRIEDFKKGIGFYYQLIKISN